MIAKNKADDKYFIDPDSPLMSNLDPNSWYPVLAEPMDYWWAQRIADIWRRHGWRVAISIRLGGKWMALVSKGFISKGRE